MPKLCARDFSEYVEVQTSNRGGDGFGGFTDSWAASSNIWCKVEDKRGSNEMNNGRIKEFFTTEFTTQYRDDITVTDRLSLDGKIYKITQVENIDRKSQFLVIYADAGRPT